MAFEIEKCEGWGRMGVIFGKNGFITPNIVNPCFFKDASNTLPTLNEFQTENLPASRRDSNNEIKERDLSFNPSCFIYPSLQMQGKSLEDINSLDDFFPIDINKISGPRPSFHLLPYDLPTIHLDQYIRYLEKLNEINQPKLDDQTKIILSFPLIPEILKTKLSPLENSAVDAVCLGDISSLLTHPSLLIKYLTLVKSWISPNLMLYAPAVPSSYVSILVYLGIDLFDLLFLELSKASSERQSYSILEQEATSATFSQVLQLTRRALSTTKLRDLTRVFANSYPYLKTLLRISDSQLSLEEGTPLYTPTLYCTDETDFTRPEVTRFRNRVKTRYIPLSNLLGVIFLPCSAKKPYSQSKSHNLYRRIIQQNLKGKRHFIEEFILTSPLGVVPRNLEYCFPAAHYDIPVTGEWSQIERQNLTQDLTDLFSKLQTSIPLVGYVKGAEREILENVCKQQKRQILILNQNIESLTSREALTEFAVLLNESFQNVPTSPRTPSQLLFLRTVANFQFGKGTGAVLIPDNVKIHGRKERGLRVKLDGEHLLTFRPETGYLTLSLSAGRLLMHHAHNLVTFDGKKIIGSTIFTKAIIKADSEIRPNEEVIVVNQEGDLIAVGISRLSGDLLVKMKHGKGINIRQKIK